MNATQIKIGMAVRFAPAECVLPWRPTSYRGIVRERVQVDRDPLFLVTRPNDPDGGGWFWASQLSRWPNKLPVRQRLEIAAARRHPGRVSQPSTPNSQPA